MDLLRMGPAKNSKHANKTLHAAQAAALSRPWQGTLKPKTLNLPTRQQRTEENTGAGGRESERWSVSM